MPNDQTGKPTGFREERYKAWCALNEEGVPIATSIRNNEADVPGEAVECRVVIRKPCEKPADTAWSVVIKEFNNEHT